jgi:cytochrome oxidase Cu insertion factor (SCO1/SenC/PrrC family)
MCTSGHDDATPASAIGRRARVSPRRAAAVTLALAVLAAIVPSAPGQADPLSDLLFDLQFVPLDRQPAPEFTLTGLDGKPVSVGQLKGRVVLLYFWATW